MSLPFTPDAFLRVFADYNQAVWPAQVFLYVLAVVVTGVAHRGVAGATRWIAFGLALFWAWMGGVYHIGFFRSINPAALGFGIAFLLQASLFVVWGVAAPAAGAGEVKGARFWLGGTMLVYALAVYPLVGWLIGHRFPSSATFGLPCPTTIATLGLVVWARPRPPWWVLSIPFAWAVVGSSAAFALGMWEDLGLLAAAVAAAAWLWRDRGSFTTPAPSRDSPTTTGVAARPMATSTRPADVAAIWAERLIERFMPQADVTECREVLVHAPADMVFDIAQKFDMQSIPLVRTLFWLRGKLLRATPPPPRASPKGLVAETTALGWGVLAERAGRELVMGAVTQPWKGDVVFTPVAPDRFLVFSTPDLVKIVWTLEAEPLGPCLTWFRTETRVLATDEEARRKFRSYWRWARFGIVLIRLLMLPSLRREAERRQQMRGS